MMKSENGAAPSLSSGQVSSLTGVMSDELQLVFDSDFKVIYLDRFAIRNRNSV